MIPVFAAATDISFLQFKTYSLGTVFLFFSFFLIVLIIVLAIAYRMIARQKKLEINAIEQQFVGNCRRFNFEPREIAVLKQAVSKLQGANCNDIFDVQTIYERSIHEKIENAIDTGVDVKEIELLYSSIRKKLHFILFPEGVPLTSTRSISSGHSISLVDIKCEARLIENNETCLVLRYPEEITILVKPESVLRIAFARSNDGLYAADLRVIEHSDGKIKCRHSITLKRHQLRKDVRMRITSKVKLFFRDNENKRISFEGKLFDISAGGFCFETSAVIPEKTIVGIEYCSLPVQVTGVKASIIASSQRKKDEEIIYKYHASYTDIPFEKKEKIVAYLFLKMREQQKR